MRGPPRPDKRPRFQDFKTMSGDVWRKNGYQWWDREPGDKANVVIFEDVDPLWGFALHPLWLWMWNILIAKYLNRCVLDRFWVIVWVTCCFLLRLSIFPQEWNQILGDLTSIHFCPAMEFSNPQNRHLASGYLVQFRTYIHIYKSSMILIFIKYLYIDCIDIILISDPFV